MRKLLDKVFGGIEMTWVKVIVFAIIMGIYTALMAMFVPDGNSFHDIAVTPEWWVLPAILIIVNCKKPLDAAAKVFVFFLISQPLVYLIQVPFSSMGWALFGYYHYWFIATLLTFPAGFVGWYIKNDKWYSGVILSSMVVLLVWTGVGYVKGFSEDFPNHLLSVIYCFGIIPVFIFGIFKKWQPRVVTAVVSVAAFVILMLVQVTEAPYDVRMNAFLQENNITFVGKPYVSFYAGEAEGTAEIHEYNEGEYIMRLEGRKGKKYEFTLSDDSETEYKFEYYYDNDLQTVVVKQIGGKTD